MFHGSKSKNEISHLSNWKVVMKKKEIASGIVVYSDALDNYESLINDIEEGMISAQISWIDAGVKTDGEAHINKKSRDTLALAVPYNDKEIKEFVGFSGAFFSSLSNIFLKYFEPLENDYKVSYNLATDWHDQYTILKYGVGQKFVNHIDDHRDYLRRMSTIYYLNDDYEGGELIFPRFGIKYKPKANDFIIFPSNYIYNHSVAPVTSGQRYAVVSWLK